MVDGERPRDREHRRRAREQPRERYLLGRGAMAVGDLGDRGRIGAAQRKERDERDPLLGTVVDDLLVRALRQVVAVLDRRDRDDLAPALELLDADLREPDVPDLTAIAVRGDRAEALLERRLRVDAVQVVEVDRAGAQAPQALVDLRAQRLGAARSGREAALRRDDHAVRRGRERFTDRRLALAVGVGVGGVDEPDPGGGGLPDELDVLGRLPEAVRAEAEARDLRVTEHERPWGGHPVAGCQPRLTLGSWSNG